MNKKTFYIILCGINLILYITFLILDVTGITSIYVKYSSIVVCLAASTYISITSKKLLPAITMALTLFADTFLLLLDSCYIAGVTSFALIQTIYAVYIYRKFYITHDRIINHIESGTFAADSNNAASAADIAFSSHYYLRFFLPRLIIYCVTAAIVLYSYGPDAVILVSLWSYINLSANVIQSALYSRGILCRRLFALAMLLFWGCDTCVGLMNMSDYITGILPYGIISAVTYMIWLFYLPSQVLIVLHFTSFYKKNDMENYI